MHGSSDQQEEEEARRDEEKRIIGEGRDPFYLEGHGHSHCAIQLEVA